MKRYEKIAKKVSAKTINADASAMILNLIRRLQSHFKELERIESSLVDGVRQVEREGIGREVKNALVSIIENVRDAQSGLLNMATVAKGLATDVEMRFLT